jgi:hypothetical protein
MRIVTSRYGDIDRASEKKGQSHQALPVVLNSLAAGAITAVVLLE